MGDFNEILSLDEKSGGSLRSFTQMQAFHQAISNCNLEDLGAAGVSLLGVTPKQKNDLIGDWVHQIGEGFSLIHVWSILLLANLIIFLCFWRFGLILLLSTVVGVASDLRRCGLLILCFPKWWRKFGINHNWGILCCRFAVRSKILGLNCSHGTERFLDLERRNLSQQGHNFIPYYNDPLIHWTNQRNFGFQISFMS